MGPSNPALKRKQTFLIPGAKVREADLLRDCCPHPDNSPFMISFELPGPEKVRAYPGATCDLEDCVRAGNRNSLLILDGCSSHFHCPSSTAAALISRIIAK